jgi:hypothetical protein
MGGGALAPPPLAPSPVKEGERFSGDAYGILAPVSVTEGEAERGGICWSGRRFQYKLEILPGRGRERGE